MKIIKVLLTFIRFSIPVKIAFYRNILLKMTGNPDFATPDVSLALAKTAVDTLETSMLAAAEGDRTATAVMHDNEGIADTIFRTLAAYVERISKGIAAMILSTGFDISKEPVAHEKAVLAVTDGSNSGIVVLVAKTIEHAGAYIWMMKGPKIGGVDQVFKIIGNTTQARFESADLIPGEIYNFCVAAITPSGTTDFCAPVSKMVI